MVLAEAPILRPAPERPMTVPRDTQDLPRQLETILEIYWQNVQPNSIVPLLEADDITSAWHNNWDAFKRWSHMAGDAIINVLGERAALLLAEQSESILRNLNSDCGERLLGNGAAKSFDFALELGGSVRRSITELFEEKDAKEIAKVGLGNVPTLIQALDFCSMAVMQYLTTEDESYCVNATTLALWSYQYAEMASGEWGFVELDLGLSSTVTRA